MENKKCFSCGSVMNLGTKELAEMYKKLYEEKGVNTWFFRKSEKEEIQFADNASFKQIKKTLGKNAEFSHISEFRRN